MNPPHTTLTREELYKEVWETSIQQLCRKYGISDVGLAEVCKRMGIPRPPRGYWRRLQTGAKPRKVPLPKASEEDKLEVQLSGNPGKSTTPAAKSKPRIAKRPPVLSDTMDDPHPLVAKTLIRQESVTQEQDGIVIPKAKRALALRVSRPEINRSMRLLDTLIKSWEAEGLEVRLVRNGDEFATFLCSGEERLQIRIEEGIEAYDPDPTDDEKLQPKWKWKKRENRRPTGILTLHLEGDQAGSYTRFRRRYQDRPGMPFETKAPQIWAAGIDYFEKRASYIIQLKEMKRVQELAEQRWEEEQRQWQVEWEREKEKQRLCEEERRKAQELAESAESWAKANQIREFIPICEASLKERGIDSDSISKWTCWARTARRALIRLLRVTLIWHRRTRPSDCSSFTTNIGDREQARIIPIPARCQHLIGHAPISESGSCHSSARSQRLINPRSFSPFLPFSVMKTASRSPLPQASPRIPHTVQRIGDSNRKQFQLSIVGFRMPSSQGNVLSPWL